MLVKGVNKAQLSRETGIPYSTIDSLYKKGYENIKLSTLRKLANYFNCSLDFLVDDEIQGKLSFDEATEYLNERLNAANTANPEKQKLEKYFEQLNLTGQKEAAKRVEELTHIEKYTKKD